MSLTMSKLESLGFEVVKSYEHDHFITQRRRKGNITIETTWDKNQEHKVVSQDFTIEDGWFDLDGELELVILDKILNK
jgi:hypothetical protein